MSESLIAVHPADTGAPLVNPNMGWVLHFFDNGLNAYGARLAPSDTLADFPGLSTVYLRLGWDNIEPREGQFDWSIVDAPAQRWIDVGKRVAFRFTCCESEGGLPAWVREAGAAGHRYEPGHGAAPNGSHWEVDYNDPIFLEKLDRFLEAAAERYDGDPNVEFIDVGSFGIWGEGHTYWSSKLTYDAETLMRHIDLHTKHFKSTLLVANDDFSAHGRGDKSVYYAARQGLSLRDDSILVLPPPEEYISAHLAAPFWPTVPVVLESEHYGPSVKRGVWGDGSTYLRAVEDYHASLVSIHWWPREFLEANRELVERINLRMGYRLQMVEAAWEPSFTETGEWQFRTVWRNAGVAPCYPGGFPAMTLKDNQGGIVAVFVDEALDARDLGVAAPEDAPTEVSQRSVKPAIKPNPGEYGVYVSVGSRTGTPQIALPLPDVDGHKRYRLGTVRVV